MNLYLIRHGIAEPRRSDQPDASRALTEKGRARMIGCVKALKRLGVRFDTLWHSPLVRAAETATLLEPLVEGDSQETPLLAKSPTRPLLELFQGHGDDVAAVGHEPWLGELLAMLCMKVPAPSVPIKFKKGSVAVLEGEPVPGGMALQALMPPRMLRKVSKKKRVVPQ